MHIVEDVSELCTRMANIDRGEILLEAEPLRAVDELKGRIWRRVIERSALLEVEREHTVISTKLLAGRTVVHVHGDASPGAGSYIPQPTTAPAIQRPFNQRYRAGAMASPIRLAERRCSRLRTLRCLEVGRGLPSCLYSTSSLEG